MAPLRRTLLFALLGLGAARLQLGMPGAKGIDAQQQKVADSVVTNFTTAGNLTSGELAEMERHMKQMVKKVHLNPDAVAHDILLASVDSVAHEKVVASVNSVAQAMKNTDLKVAELEKKLLEKREQLKKSESERKGTKAKEAKPSASSLQLTPKEDAIRSDSGAHTKMVEDSLKKKDDDDAKSQAAFHARLQAVKQQQEFQWMATRHRREHLKSRMILALELNELNDGIDKIKAGDVTGLSALAHQLQLEMPDSQARTKNLLQLQSTPQIEAILSDLGARVKMVEASLKKLDEDEAKSQAALQRGVVLSRLGSPQAVKQKQEVQGMAKRQHREYLWARMVKAVELKELNDGIDDIKTRDVARDVCCLALCCLFLLCLGVAWQKYEPVSSGQFSGPS